MDRIQSVSLHRTIDAKEKQALQSLRLEWAGFLLASLLSILLSFFILSSQWGENYAWRWLIITSAMTAYLFVFLWRNLGTNRLKTGDGDLFPSFGAANSITIIRAVMNAALAGFLAGPWPPGWLAWAPGLLYLLSCILDHIDGIVARVTGKTTVLGETMDMKWDGTGMVSAVILTVLYGQAPVPFLLVGLARPLFVFGEWWRRRGNLPMYPLPFSWVSRTMAGVMMGLISVLLLPVFAPPATHVAAVLFMLPFLINFLRDWFVVSGVITPAAPDKHVKRSRFRQAYQTYLPLVLRAALLFLLASLVIYQLSLPNPGYLTIGIAAIAIPALFFGIAGRVFALAILLMAGFGFQISPLEWRYWLLMLASISLFLIGTGRYSLWKPEEWLMNHRAGERRTAGETRQ